MSIWVLVADASRARLFKALKRNGPLEELRDWTHPESRLHEGDLVTDGDGSNSGPSGRYGVAADPVHKPAEAERFAHELVRDLEKARAEGAFSRIYLMASPKVLGMLHKYASTELLDRVSGEIAKDLTTHSAEDVRKQLPPHL